MKNKENEQQEILELLTKNTFCCLLCLEEFRGKKKTKKEKRRTER